MAVNWVLAVGLTALTAGHAFADEPVAADREAVEGIVSNQVSSWNRGDAVAFSRHVRSDIIMTNTVGMVAVGPAAFEKPNQFIFSSFYKNTHVTLTISHLPDRFLVGGISTVCSVPKVLNYAPERGWRVVGQSFFRASDASRPLRPS